MDVKRREIPDVDERVGERVRVRAARARTCDWLVVVEQRVRARSISIIEMATSCEQLGASWLFICLTNAWDCGRIIDMAMRQVKESVFFLSSWTMVVPYSMIVKSAPIFLSMWLVASNPRCTSVHLPSLGLLSLDGFQESYPSSVQTQSKS